MPQMSPLMWMTLFIMFSIVMIMFNILNYFFFMNKPVISALKMNINKMVFWKW
nr:ATP synthase F0 subunit 8 [Pentaspinula unispinula]